MNSSDSARQSVLHSPWYWAYAFCAAALAGLVLIGPKFYQRQVLEERNFQGRTQVMQRAAGQAGDERQMSVPGRTMLTLWPLYLLLTAGFLGAWMMVWWRHFRRRTH